MLLLEISQDGVGDASKRERELESDITSKLWQPDHATDNTNVPALSHAQYSTSDTSAHSTHRCQPHREQRRRRDGIEIVR